MSYSQSHLRKIGPRKPVRRLLGHSHCPSYAAINAMRRRRWVTGTVMRLQYGTEPVPWKYTDQSLDFTKGL